MLVEVFLALAISYNSNKGIKMWCLEVIKHMNKSKKKSEEDRDENQSENESTSTPKKQ